MLFYPSHFDRQRQKNGVAVRVVEYRLEGVAGAEPLYRLLTTILDPEPAGDGTLERYLSQDGRPGLGRGSVSKRQMSWRPSRESERVIVPKKPGNAGGGKDPYFWNASEGAEEG